MYYISCENIYSPKKCWDFPYLLPFEMLKLLQNEHHTKSKGKMYEIIEDDDDSEDDDQDGKYILVSTLKLCTLELPINSLFKLVIINTPGSLKFVRFFVLRVQKHRYTCVLEWPQGWHKVVGSTNRVSEEANFMVIMFPDVQNLFR